MSESRESHEVRALRWKIKQLGKQAGKQGQTIYELRCQLAELRSLMSKEQRGYVRTLEREVTRLAERVEDLVAEAAVLKSKTQGQKRLLEMENVSIRSGRG